MTATRDTGSNRGGDPVTIEPESASSNRSTRAATGRRTGRALFVVIVSLLALDVVVFAVSSAPDHWFAVMISGFVGIVVILAIVLRAFTRL